MGCVALHLDGLARLGNELDFREVGEEQGEHYGLLQSTLVGKLAVFQKERVEATEVVVFAIKIELGLLQAFKLTFDFHLVLVTPTGGQHEEQKRKNFAHHSIKKEKPRV